MKLKFILSLLCVVSAIVAFGCMNSGGKIVVTDANGELNSNHLGWGSPECMSCHQLNQLLAPSVKDNHEEYVVNGSIDTKTNCVGSCHGYNGCTGGGGGSGGGCLGCHKGDGSGYDINKRFVITHSYNDGQWTGTPKNYLLSNGSGVCKTCHVVPSGHNKGTVKTTMAEGQMKNEVCGYCHLNYGYPTNVVTNPPVSQTLPHFGEADCYFCHSPKIDNFTRDVTDNITGHKASLGGCACHSSVPNHTGVLTNVSNCSTCHYMRSNTTGHEGGNATLKNNLSATVGDVDCQICHTPASKHPTIAAAGFGSRTCFSCHGQFKEFTRSGSTIIGHSVEKNPHNGFGNNCSNCHPM